MLMEKKQSSISPNQGGSALAKAISLEWMGQTAASLFWIASVLTYGITSTGDQLQMAAASAWLLANIATLFKAKE